jgi:DNA-binding ferritin-like protein (Dps family)
MLLLLIFLVVVTGALAEEGMFPMYMLPKVREIKLKSSELFNPTKGGLSDAVIIIGGGTGSFVSPDGLVLTNHHVAFDAIKTNSTPERDYLENGFYAAELKDELPARGYEAYQTIGLEDVSAKILEGITDQTPPVERIELINRRATALEKATEDNENGIQGRVVTMLEGKSYYLVKYLRFRDVRLVYAPPRSIGNFGGEVDNWMWPRHTGDFSFMRVYVSPQGKPARYDTANVPYKPQRYLPVCKNGIKPDETVFIMGYPGTTYRNRTSYAIYYSQEIVYPFRIKLFQAIIDLLEEQSKANKEVELLLASQLKGFYNSIKNNRGLLEGFQKDQILAKKQAQERTFLKQLAQKPTLEAQYGNLLPAIKAAYNEYYRRSKSDMVLEYLRVVSLVSEATTVYKYSLEKVKPDSLREPGYQDFLIARTKERLEDRRKDFYAPADAGLFKLMLKELVQFPASERPVFINQIFGELTGAAAENKVNEFVDKIYANTKMLDVELTKKLFDYSTAEIDALNDPLLQFAAQLVNENIRLKEKRDTFSGKLNQLHAQYFTALTEVTGKPFIPDANRTLRFTYGKVKGYYPRDGVFYVPQTGLRGVIQKKTDSDPFDAPGKLVELYQKRDFGGYYAENIKDLPVDFLSTCDITGGNSGSPVLNSRGEVVGCAFDGNWEALTNDYQYNAALTRTIAVDIRYVLFILDKFSGAQRVLNELSIR